MKTLIKEVNDKLKNILEELSNQKDELESSLKDVQEKIDSKIEEAKGFKDNIDASKEKIERLDKEIESLKDDLQELTNRFSNKDLNAILETGNKEINLQIDARLDEIEKEKEKINDYTKQAEMIKDLLLNLKNDKEAKNNKLEDLSKVYSFYQKEFNSIIDYSSNNPDSLTKEEIKEVKEEVDEKEVFDTIESIEKEENNENINLFESQETEEVEQPDNKIDFKALNESIDREYENIFGESLEPTAPIEEVKPVIEEAEVTEEIPYVEENIFEEPEPVLETEPVKGEESPKFDFNFENGFSLSENELNEEPVKEEKNELDSFFNTNNLDVTRFTLEDQEKIKNEFNLINYTKTLDILRKNNIDLNYIYDNANIFNIEHTELETIINKLLLANQSTKNISYVLSSLPYIKSSDLQEVIDSYQNAIKDANITDLILKAKHLNELSGGNE